MNKYVSFISDEDLLEAIEELYNVYYKAHSEIKMADFYKNKIDPIKLLFDKEFLNHSIEDVINLEIIRKKDKTISNGIGDFHETLLGSISGYTKYAVGYGYDIKADDDSIYVDIKNKHNTVKGSNLPDLYDDLIKYVDSSSNKEAKGYWAQIIANGSFNEAWKIPAQGKDDERIFKISADQLYSMMTGIDNSFKELCVALPIAIKDFLEGKDPIGSEENTIYLNLKKQADENKTDIITELFNKTFDVYIGFPIKNEE